MCISPLPGPRAVCPVMKKLSRKAGLAPTVSSSSKASATVGRLTCRPGDMTVKSFAVTPSVCVVCHVRGNCGRNRYDRPCRHRGATASISAKLSLRPVRRGRPPLKMEEAPIRRARGSVRSYIGLQLLHIRTSQRKVRNLVCLGPLAGDRTTRHPQNYLPSQLPPSPTAHEYLSFPCLLSPSDEGS